MFNPSLQVFKLFDKRHH